MRSLLLLVFTITLYHFSSAQERLHMDVNNDGTSVKIRWSASTPEVWTQGTKYGYKLLRYTVSRNDTALTNEEYYHSALVLVDSILPEAESYFDSLALTNDLAGVAGGALFSDSLKVINVDSTSLVEMYNISKDEDNRFSLGGLAASMDFEVARAMGLGYIDTSLISGEEYFYVVQLKVQPNEIAVFPGGATLHADSMTQLPIISPVFAHVYHNQVSINWKVQQIAYDYIGYYIERSSNGVNFSRLNDVVFLDASFEEKEYTMQFFDSLPNLIDSFYYRVVGKGVFGQEGPPSEVVAVVGMEKAKEVATRISNSSILADGSILVEWSLYEGNAVDVVHFDIYKANHPDGEYVKLNSTPLASTVNTYLDTDPWPSNYYKIIATDINGYEHESIFHLIQEDDETPPSVPTGVSAHFLDNENMILSWSVNPESDMYGYRVFYSNHRDTQYAELTHEVIEDTFFHYFVNLQTLSEDMYFRVSALDNRANESAWTEALLVKRPDIIPPARPYLKSVVPLTDGIQIQWRFSGTPDVVAHRIQRKLANTSQWVNIKAYPGPQSPEQIQSHLDQSTNFKETYTYRIAAMDEAGNVSYSRAYNSRPLTPQVRGEFFDVVAEVVDQSSSVPSTFYYDNITKLHFKEILLHWDYTEREDLLEFEVYRGVGGMPMRTYATINELYWQNKKIPNGTTVPTGKFFFVDDDLLAKSQWLQQNGNVVGNTTSNYDWNSQGGGSGGGTSTPGGTTINNDTYIYQLMGKHEDGSMSPLSDPIIIQL